MFRNRKIYRRLIPFLLFAVVFTVLSANYFVFLRIDAAKKQEKYIYISEKEAGSIVDTFYRLTDRIVARCTLLEYAGENEELLNKFAPACHEDIKRAYNIELSGLFVAPGGEIWYAYPLKNNEGKIGYQYFEENGPEDTPAMRALKNKKPVVTIAASEQTGKEEFTVLIPVFREDTGFWGFVTAMLEAEDLIKITRLEKLKELEVAYRLWYEETGGRKVTLTSFSQMPKQSAVCRFYLQNLELYFSAAPIEGWQTPSTATFSFFLIDLLALLITLFFYHRVKMREAQRKLTQIAFYDSLTSCYSRQFLMTKLVDETSGKWRRRQREYSLAIVDVDQFKVINDTYGHSFGDFVLSVIANTLKGCLMQERGDYIMRYGGDEFILLFCRVTEEEFKKQLDRAVEAVRKLRFEENPDVDVSISIGGVPYTRENPLSYDEMLKAADMMLYRSKEKGKNCYTIFEYAKDEGRTD